MNKNPFLTVYDYGMGGIWAVIYAGTQAEMMAKSPELTIVTERLKWMSQKRYDGIASQNTFDTGSAPSGWLFELVKERNS